MGTSKLRLPSPYTTPRFKAQDFITRPIEYNPAISSNIDLVCGDPLLALQANAVNTLANQNIPGTNEWIAVLAAIQGDIASLLKTNPEIFSFHSVRTGFVDIRDFQTTGVVAFAKGLPSSQLRPGKQSINGHRVQVKQEYLTNSIESIEELVTQL